MPAAGPRSCGSVSDRRMSVAETTTTPMTLRVTVSSDYVVDCNAESTLTTGVVDLARGHAAADVPLTVVVGRPATDR